MKANTSHAIEGRVFDGIRFDHRRIVIRSGRVVPDEQPGSLWRLGEDQCLLPAFHDHHTHLIGTCRPPRGPVLDGTRSREAVIEELDRWLRAHPGTTPVIGEGWDESSWGDPRPLHGEDLDSVESDRPVALRRVCGHLAVLNSGAWRCLKPSGKEANRSTGTITEKLALNLSRSWPPTFEEQIEGAVRGQRLAAQCGVIGIDELGTVDTYEAVRHLDREGRLFLRVNQFLPLEECRELIRSGHGPTRSPGRLRIVGLKGFLDGSLGARTAAVERPYLDTGETGMLLWDDGELTRAVEVGVRSGFDIALHAIGLRAIRQALTALESLSDVRGVTRRIEHAEEAGTAELSRGGSIGVTWSMQPNFTARWQGVDGLYDAAVGRERSLRLNRFRSAGATGPLLFGSDNMPFGPLEGLVGAIEHPDPAERLALEEALHAYVSVSGRRAATDDLLEPGSAADLIVLETAGGDLEEAIRTRDASVVWTAAAGLPVWCDPSLDAPSFFREPIH
jgi:predicted amidohydrolase YtcJ